MADKKLFELELGTPTNSDKIAYGRVGNNYKNITVNDFKTLITSGGGNLKTRVYELTSGWDMTYVGYKSVALFEEAVPPAIFGPVIEPERIRSVNVIVRNDAGTMWYDMGAQQGGSSGNAPFYSIGKGNFIFPTWTFLTIQIINGGFFDSSDFNDAGVNRGTVTITYE